MRILHVCPGMAPSDSSDRARYVWRLAQQHAVLQTSAVFTTFSDPESPPGRSVIERRDGVTLCWVNVPDAVLDGLSSSYVNEDVESAFRKFIHEMRSDVVHFHGFERLSLGIVDIVHSKDIRTIFTPHTAWESCPIVTRRCRTDGSICTEVDTSKCGACVHGSEWAEVLESRDRARAAARRENSWGAAYQRLYERRFGDTPGWFARRPRAKVFALRKTPWEVRRRLREQTDSSHIDPFELRKQRVAQRLSAIDLITAPSKAIGEDLVANLGLSPHKVVTRPLASPAAPSVAKVRERGSARRLIYWGPIDTDPGLRQLVLSCVELVAAGNELELHLIGRVAAGEVVAWIKDEFARAGSASSVVLETSATEGGLGISLDACDLVVEPRSTFNAASVALQHAAEAGTPVLVAKKSGCANFSEEYAYGRSFDVDEPDALTRELKTFLDASAAETSRFCGPERRFRTVHHDAMDYVRIYHEVLYKKLDVDAERAQDLSPETWR